MCAEINLIIWRYRVRCLWLDLATITIVISIIVHFIRQPNVDPRSYFRSYFCIFACVRISRLCSSVIVCGSAFLFMYNNKVRLYYAFLSSTFRLTFVFRKVLGLTTVEPRLSQSIGDEGIQDDWENKLNFFLSFEDENELFSMIFITK